MSASTTSDKTAPDPTIRFQNLLGDVRAFLLDEQKHSHNALPWHMRGEQQQQEAIDRAHEAAERLVKAIYQATLTQEQPAVVGKMVQGKKKGEKMAFEIQIDARAPYRHLAMDTVGEEVMVILAGPEDATGDMGKPSPTPDQRGLYDDEDSE